MNHIAAARACLSVRSVGDEAAFLQLAPAWNELAIRGCHRLFFRHGWFSAAWAWHRADAHLNILCVYSGDELIGVLPLIRRRSVLGGQRALEFLSVPDTQFCDLLVHDNNAAIVSQALATHLLTGSSLWDVLRLERLPAASIASEILLPLLRASGTRCSLKPSDCNLFVALEGSWEDYLATRSRSLKKALNLASNRVLRAGPYEVERVTSTSTQATQLRQRLEEVVQVSGRSWKQKTGNTLEAARPRAFIERLTDFAYRAGALSIWLLRIHGRPVAMEYQVMHAEHVYALRSDFDHEHEHLSPGSFLSKCLLQALFAAGVRRYYMGPGRNLYKTRWSESGEPLYSLVAYSPTLRGRATALWPEDLKPSLRSLKARLTPF